MSVPNSPVAFDAATAEQRAENAPPSSRTAAELQVHAPSKDGKPGQLGPLRHSIPFQFNPRELVLTKASSWKPAGSRSTTKVGEAEFTQSQPCTLSLEMFIDATDKMDASVVDRVEALFSCLVKDEDGDKSPPWVVFVWGGLTGFSAYVTSVSAKYTVFTPGGMPVRAVCTVTLEEISATPAKQNPTSGGLATRDVHQVVDGDSLAGVAYAHYGDPALWRDIAEVNGIDDPMRLVVGSRLQIPAPEELEARRAQ